MKKTKVSHPNDMSFLDHLEVLRWHLIRSTLAVISLGCVAFTMRRFIFDVVIFGPKRMDFVTYRFFCETAKLIKIDSSFCSNELPFIIQSRLMAGQFSIHIWTSVWAGFILAFPYVLYEIWKFIKPGLSKKERKNSKWFVLTTSFLFFMGVLFGYYVVAPLSINFLGTYQVSELVLNEFDIESYVSAIKTSVLACGLTFQLPIVIYFLTKIGLVNPRILKKYRKISLIIILLLSAIITPPDIASQIVVSLPIFILYQISIYISKVVLRNEEKLNSK